MLTSSLSAAEKAEQHQSRTLIRIENVEKQFASRSGEGVTALAKVNLEIKENEFVSVVGPSGCGENDTIEDFGRIVVSFLWISKFQRRASPGPEVRCRCCLSTSAAIAVEYGHGQRPSVASSQERSFRGYAA